MWRSLLLGLVACDRVFGLAHGDPAVDGPTPDAPAPDVVTGMLVDVSTPNAANHVPTTLSVPLGGGAVQATVTLADGTMTPVAIGDDGTFQFEVAAPGDPYRLSLVIDGRPPIIYASSARSLQLSDVIIGRRDRLPITASTAVTITGNYTFTAGDVLEVQSTGLWTQTLLPSQAMGGSTFSLDWQKATALGGTLGALDASEHDSFYFGVYDTVTSGYAAIQKIGRSDTTSIPSGLPATVTLDVEPVAPPQLCVKLDAPKKTLVDRLSSALESDPITSAQQNFVVAAIAGPPSSATAGLSLAFASDASDTSGLVTNFRNPYAGTIPVVSITAALLENITAPGQTPTPFAEVASVFVDPTLDCTQTTTLDPGVAIPSHASVAGVSFTSDGQAISVGTGDVPVAWSLASPGPVDSYTVAVFELVPSGSNSVSTKRLSLLTTDTSAVIPAGILMPDLVYTIEITANRGTPNTATGDFATETFPFALARSFTRAFVVAP